MKTSLYSAWPHWKSSASTATIQRVKTIGSLYKGLCSEAGVCALVFSLSHTCKFSISTHRSKFKSLNLQQTANAESWPFQLSLISSAILSLPFSSLILPSLPCFSSQYPSHWDLPTLIKRTCASVNVKLSCKYFHSSNSEHIYLELSSSLPHMLPIREHCVLLAKVSYSNVKYKYRN